VKPFSAHSILADAGTTENSTGIANRSRRLSDAALAVVGREVRSAYSPVIIAGIVRVIDLALIAMIGVGVYIVLGAPEDGRSWPYVVMAFGIAAASVVIFQFIDIYHVVQYHILRPARIIIGLSVVFLLAVGGSRLAGLHDNALQAWFIAFWCVVIVALICERLVLQAVFGKWAREGRLTRRTIVVGADRKGEELITALRALEGSDLDIIGVFDDRSDDRSLENCASVPKLGNVGDILEFVRHTRVDLILFALPISAEKRILQMLRKLWVLPVDIHLSAHTNELRFRPRYYSHLGHIPTLPMFEKPITDWDMVTKWILDRVVGILLLILSAPLFAMIAIAIKLDSKGPIFFRQKRFGFNNQQIDVLKFRSLHHHFSDPLAARVVTRNDPRVTRVGRFIRKTSLDELPQLLNVVFKGDLSLVGPRPHALQGKLQNRLFDETVDGYFARHRVKPGITGWAQINGWRGEIDNETKIQKRVEFDLHYIENWSPLFDLYILCRTPLALLEAKNAY
jgi:Undecaprenyl-phosphate glucose phosphotransferase